MKRVLILLTIMAAVAIQSPNAAETKVNGRIYAGWMLDKTNGADNANEFGLSRSYLTAKSKLSEYTSARITIDLRETTIDGKTRYDMILKYGYFDWKPAFADGRATVRLGLQPTMYIDVQNGLWGRRYLEKTVSDLFKGLSSSDLGASIHVDLGNEGKLATLIGAIYNGTSYSDLSEANKQKDFNVVAIVTPLQDNDDLKRTTLVGQFYHGVQNETIGDTASASDYKHQLVSVGGLLGYSNVLDVGADINFLTDGQGPGADEMKSTGMSFHGTLYLEGLAPESPAIRTLDLFGRVDMVDPDTDADNDKSTLVILGVECAPVKGFKASVNYRSTSFDADGAETQKSINLNTEFKF